MILEYLWQILGINALAFKSVTLMIEMTAVGLVFLLLGLVVYFLRKTRPWKDVIASTGGKLAIIIDSANQAFFYPVKSKHDFNYIAERGIRMFDKEASYFAPDQMTTIGIFLNNVATTLPVKFHRFAGKKSSDPVDMLVQPNLALKAINKDGKEVEVLPKLEQVNVWHFADWLSQALNPKKWEADLSWRARKYGKINDLENATKSGFNWKILLVIIIIVVAGVLIFSFVGGRI